jgi:hypothetical protein
MHRPEHNELPYWTTREGADRSQSFAFSPLSATLRQGGIENFEPARHRRSIESIFIAIQPASHSTSDPRLDMNRPVRASRFALKPPQLFKHFRHLATTIAPSNGEGNWRAIQDDGNRATLGRLPERVKKNVQQEKRPRHGHAAKDLSAHRFGRHAAAEGRCCVADRHLNYFKVLRAVCVRVRRKTLE